MNATFEDIEEIGIELTDEQISLVAGGSFQCTTGTCTNSVVSHCWVGDDGLTYCYFTDEGDED